MDMASDLRSRMAAEKVSVAELATRLGLSRNAVSSYRHGHTPIPHDMALTLMDMGLLSEESILAAPRRATPEAAA